MATDVVRLISSSLMIEDRAAHQYILSDPNYSQHVALPSLNSSCRDNYENWSEPLEVLILDLLAV